MEAEEQAKPAPAARKKVVKRMASIGELNAPYAAIRKSGVDAKASKQTSKTQKKKERAALVLDSDKRATVERAKLEWEQKRKQKQEEEEPSSDGQNAAREWARKEAARMKAKKKQLENAAKQAQVEDATLPDEAVALAVEEVASRVTAKRQQWASRYEDSPGGGSQDEVPAARMEPPSGSPTLADAIQAQSHTLEKIRDEITARNQEAKSEIEHMRMQLRESKQRAKELTGTEVIVL